MSYPAPTILTRARRRKARRRSGGRCPPYKRSDERHENQRRLLSSVGTADGQSSKPVNPDDRRVPDASFAVHMLMPVDEKRGLCSFDVAHEGIEAEVHVVVAIVDLPRRVVG